MIPHRGVRRERRAMLLAAALWSAPALADGDADGWEPPQDCDDGDGSRHPEADEGCDGVDTDCDGAVPPDERDLDGDGFPLCGGYDCDDLRAWIFPGAPEACDGLDGDCDGAVRGTEFDADGDGFRACAGDCDDQDPARHPGADEGCDGLDTDCDGAPPASEVDADGDGVAPCAGDCDDDRAAVRPGQLEVCDGLDGDCDGVGDPPCDTPAPAEPAAGCTARGCAWSFQPAWLLPWVAWRRRARSRRPLARCADARPGP